MFTLGFEKIAGPFSKAVKSLVKERGLTRTGAKEIRSDLARELKLSRGSDESLRKKLRPSGQHVPSHGKLQGWSVHAEKSIPKKGTYKGDIQVRHNRASSTGFPRTWSRHSQVIKGK